MTHILRSLVAGGLIVLGACRPVRAPSGKARTMKKQLSTLSLLLLTSTALQVSAEAMKTEIKLPGITFTRSLNGAAANAKVEDGTLTLRSDARRDNFRDPDGKLSDNTAPLLLTEVDNKQPFTLKARVTPTFLKTYDAGTLYIYVKEDLWLKMAMEMDERNKTRMVSVRTIETSDDNNHDVIETKSVYMKISSDTETVGFYYPLDNKSWQLIRLFKNDYPAAIWVVRTEDAALLPIPGAVLYNNVYGKGLATRAASNLVPWSMP